MKHKFIVGVVFTLVIVSCTSDSPVVNENNPVDEFDYSSYPTTVDALTTFELSSKLAEYIELNDSAICTELNQYGFCEYSLYPCLDQPILREEITDESGMISIAESTIVLNKKFTGVDNSDELIIFRSQSMNGCVKCDGSSGDIKPIIWKIEYEPQVYNGYEVIGTELVAFLNKKSVIRLGGNWFQEIAIPPEDKITFSDLKENLTGHQFTILCLLGNDTITVAESNIFPETRKVVYPVYQENRIELRVAWEVFIVNVSGIKVWRMYIDTTTGEVLAEEQTILC